MNGWAKLSRLSPPTMSSMRQFAFCEAASVSLKL
jgi:hypothetical protein